MHVPKAANSTSCITLGTDGASAQAPSAVPLDNTPPDEVRLSRSARSLELVWPERTLRFGFAQLRCACRCADCTAKRRAGFAIDVPEDIEITGINPLGTVALQFIFSDGHERGIFPWAYLGEIARRDEVSGD